MGSCSPPDGFQPQPSLGSPFSPKRPLPARPWPPRVQIAQAQNHQKQGPAALRRARARSTVCIPCLRTDSAAGRKNGVWLRFRHIALERALPPAVSAHSAFRMTSKRVLVEVYAHRSRYSTRPRLRLGLGGGNYNCNSSLLGKARLLCHRIPVSAR